MKFGFFRKMVIDTKGGVSSKRFITLVAFFFVCVGYLVALFFNTPIQDFIFNGMLYIAVAGLGANAIEHFSASKGSEIGAKAAEPKPQLNQPTETSSITVGVELNRDPQNPQLLFD